MTAPSKFCKEIVLTKGQHKKTIVLSKSSFGESDEYYVSVMTGPDEPQPTGSPWKTLEDAEAAFSRFVNTCRADGWQ
jgi:hypothetical protein